MKTITSAAFLKKYKVGSKVDDLTFSDRLQIGETSKMTSNEKHPNEVLYFFKNCTFLAGVNVIEDCRSKKENKLQSNHLLGFHNCTLYDSYHSENTSISMMSFEECLFKTHKQDTSRSSLRISNYNGKITIIDCSGIGKIELVNVSSYLIWIGGKISIITLEKCRCDNFEIGGGSFQTIIGGLSSDSQTVIDNFRIDNSLIRDLKIPKKTSNLFIHAGYYSKISFTPESILSRVIIEDAVSIENKESIPLKIGSLSAYGAIIQGLFSIQNGDIRKLTFLSCQTTNSGSIHLSQLTLRYDFFMEDSIFRNINVNRLVFLHGCYLGIEGSDIHGSTWTSIDWPRHHKITESTDTFHPVENWKDLHRYGTYFRAQRDSYRQLKQVMLNQGNRIDGLAFYRREMMAQLGLMIFHWPKSTWVIVKQIQDLFIHTLSLIVSQYGQSWFRPFVWLLLIQALLYYKLSQLEITSVAIVDIDQHSWSALWVGFKESIAMLNPVYKLDVNELSGSDKSTYGFILVLMRLFSAYFIYHIIRASRRYAFK